MVNTLVELEFCQDSGTNIHTLMKSAWDNDYRYPRPRRCIQG